MKPGKKKLQYLLRLGIILLQLIMTQLVTLFVSFFFPGMENFPQTKPVMFVLMIGITFSIGVFLPGWLGLKMGVLKSAPRYAARIAGTLIGAYIPLVVALIIYHPLEAGNAFFFVSILVSILGFYLPGWLVGGF